MVELPLYIVDAFSTVRFRGNPASVCVLEREIPESTMQAIAGEMKHSETAFARPLDGWPGVASRFRLRWFTPEVEVPLCGHATLATAVVIMRALGNPAGRLHFETKSGELSARREGTGIALDFPAEVVEPTEVGPKVCAALGVQEVKGAWCARGESNLLLELGSESEVRGLAPDFPRLCAARGEAPFLGVIVTAAGSGEFDFVSRYFAPWLGVDEDPVTGAAHCALTPYWSRRTGKREMRAYQASRRGGEMKVRLNGNRVDLVGEAVIVAEGTLRLD